MKIAVIGAGIAGLAAAGQLARAGHDVVVFEKSRGPGGRVATRRVANVELTGAGTVDLAFDHGAQYFTVRDPRFARVVDEWATRRLVSTWTARIVSFDGEGWEAVAPGTERFVGRPGMSAIGRHLASGLDVRYETRVDALTELAAYDRIVVATPAPRAAALLHDVPALASRAASVAMRPCWTALAAFEAAVRTRFDAAFVTGSPLAWMARNQSKPGRGATDTWVLHASTAWSASHLEDQPDTVAPFLLGAFDDLVPAGVPRPCYLAAHRWRFAGADPSLSVGALHDAASGIVVCGDWCAGPRIEDAYLSGLEAAGRV